MRRAADVPLRHWRLSRANHRDSVPRAVGSKAPRCHRGLPAFGYATRPFRSGSHQRGLKEEEDKAMRVMRTRVAIAMTRSDAFRGDALALLGCSFLFAAMIAAMLSFCGLAVP